MKGAGALLQRFVPGKDAVERPGDIRAEVNEEGELRIWHEYTDAEGGSLAGIRLSRSAYRRLFRYLVVHPGGLTP
jgi:hypothetical protein